jgi:lipopolysaccharide transport system permease protein
MSTTSEAETSELRPACDVGVKPARVAGVDPGLMTRSFEERELRVIEPGHTQRHYFRELWAYRGLIYHMAVRDVRLRYKQTLLGVGWPLVQPLMSMLVLTFVFSRVAGFRAPGGVPYAVLVLSGLVPWQLFATGLTSVGLSVLSSEGLIDRVYFPRMALPIKGLSVALHNAVISALLLLCAMLLFGIVPSPRVLLLPVFLLLAATFALSLGLFLSIWNALYRDFLHLLPFLLQLAMYVSPVGFVSTAIPEEFAWVSALNPMSAAIDGCRYALLPEQASYDWAGFGGATAIVAVILLAGVRFFRQRELSLVERI